MLLVLFSSELLHRFFIPFVSHYLATLDNPWNFFYLHSSLNVEFPYNPLMLYIFSFFYAPIHFLSINTIAVQNFFFKLPIFIADCLIAYILLKQYPQHYKKVLFFYFCSPIIFYACYLHSQLDLIPTALVFTSIYFLKKKRLPTSSIFLGLALATKFHIAAGLPLVAIYLFKNSTVKKTLLFLGTSSSIFFILIAPFMLSSGYYHLVLYNPKHLMLFDFFIPLGSLAIYPPILILATLYGRFIAYPKINNDLFDAFLAITFSCLVFLIPPAPGWYIWMHPFLSILFIKLSTPGSFTIPLYLLLNTTYILFFVFCHHTGTADLIFLNKIISLKLQSKTLINIAFTFLETSILLTIYFLYKFGIKSNSVYARTQSLIMGISGDSGVGKTTFMKDLKSILGSKATILEGDGDHKWERGNSNWQKFTHLDPKANYLHRQAEDILMLKQGTHIERINYNHATGNFDKPTLIQPNDVIILAGLHPFYLPKMRKLIDLKIFINPDWNLQMHWKIKRDMHERGHSLDRIMNQINQRQTDRSKHIAPQKEFADLVISYFTTDSFEIGSPSSNPRIQVKITLDSSITLETLLKNLMKQNIALEWDYEADLERQYVILHEPIPATTIATIAQETLINIEEIIAPNISWQNDNRGFVQLITLLTMSEKMKESTPSWQKNTQSYSTWTAPSTTITPPTMQL